MNHPLGLQVLAQPVVAELTKRRRLAIEKHDNSGNNQNHISVNIGKRDAFGEAIKLLKGDAP